MKVLKHPAKRKPSGFIRRWTPVAVAVLYLIYVFAGNKPSELALQVSTSEEKFITSQENRITRSELLEKGEDDYSDETNDAADYADHDSNEHADNYNEEDDADTEIDSAIKVTAMEDVPMPDTPFLRALYGCETLDCISAAHKIPREPGQFPFPHFIIIGFQKSATTSLYGHLAGHPQLLKSAAKEPEVLTMQCNYKPPEGCPPWAEKRYINEILRLPQFIQSNGTRGAYEASTHIVRNGDRLAPKIRALFPWLKLIILIREPISRAASMLVHAKDKNNAGCLAEGHTMDYCLLHKSQINGAPAGAKTTNYTYAVESWLNEWPWDQIFVLQYETLTNEETDRAQLRHVKSWLGIRPGIPGRHLGAQNSRRFVIQPDGWKMPRASYEQMIEMVRPDTEALLKLLHKTGKITLKEQAAWEEKWRQHYESNLNTCDETGECTILLS